MNKVCRIALLSLLTLAGSLAFAARTYETGRLLNATTEDRLKHGTSDDHAVYTVQIEDMIYTVRGEKVKANTKDYTQGMVIGDPVEARVDGEHVYLRTPRGKQIKTDILTRARGNAQ